MSADIKSLQRYVEQKNAEKTTAQEVIRIAETEAARQRLMPLQDRLARVLGAIPSEVQKEGLSLTSLQARGDMVATRSDEAVGTMYC